MGARNQVGPLKAYELAIRYYQDRSRLCTSPFDSQLHRILTFQRSGIFYKPFGRQHQITVREPHGIKELSEAPELSQRAVYAEVSLAPPTFSSILTFLEIFGFKHTMSKGKISYDPQKMDRIHYRLFSRAIRVNGVSQLDSLCPYLQKRLMKPIDELVNPHVTSEGM